MRIKKKSRANMMEPNEDISSPEEKTTSDEKALQKYSVPVRINLSETDSFIEGIYKGIQLLAGKGFNGTDLYLAYFEQKNGSLACCPIAAGLKNFLIDTNYQKGGFLKVTRTGTQQSGSYKIGLYDFEYQEEYIKLDKPEFNLLQDASDIYQIPLQLEAPGNLDESDNLLSF